MLISDTLDFSLDKPSAITIGKFDGLHLGHMTILNEILRAKEQGLAAVVVTFIPSPGAFFSGKPEKNLLTADEKRSLLASLGIDCLVEFPFDQKTAAIPAEEFAREYLVRRLKARLIAAGDDLSFGKGGRGNPALLQRLAPQHGFSLRILHKLTDNGREISSSYIKEELHAGHMEKVNALMGRSFSLSGEVVRGAHLGHTLGFPTLNLIPAPDKLLPPGGVYYTLLHLHPAHEGTKLPGASDEKARQLFGMTNVGRKPTAEKKAQLGVETHLLDFDEELYGRQVRLEFLHHTRKERKFADLEKLKEMLQRDLAGARQYFAKYPALPVLLLFLLLTLAPIRTQAASGPIAKRLPIAGISAFMAEEFTRDEYVEAWENAKGKYFGYTHIGLAGTEDNNLNIREKPEKEGKLVGKLPKNAGCEVLSRDGDWYYIKSGKVEGYVFADYLLTGPMAIRRARNEAAVMATSTTGGLRVREEPSLEADIVTLVAEGEQLEVIEEQDNWVKVYVDDDELYVSADYVNVAISLEKAVSMKELAYGQGVSDTRIDLVNYAKKFLGNPYVWGGTSLTKGADCSGYVMQIFKQFGISLPHSSKAQANCGTKISASQLKPGDLIFYGKRSTINHVAIYIGGGQVINASNKRNGICIKGMNYRTPLKYVRILNN